MKRISDEEFEGWADDLSGTGRDAFVVEARRARASEKFLLGVCEEVADRLQGEHGEALRKEAAATLRLSIKEVEGK